MRLNEWFSTLSIISPSIYCTLINARNRLRRKAHLLRPSVEEGIYVVEDGKDELYICRRSRHNRSKKGIAKGIENLAGQYGLGTVRITRPGGVFVDCGANVGELGIWACSHGMQYVAFEPEPLEARCCDLNNFKGKSVTHRKALWHTNSTLEFYSEAETADGSLFAQSSAAIARRVEAIRLDAIISPADLVRGTSILKVEAEGAEPEVLQGASQLLAYFDYVTVDCGPERGMEKKDTFLETNTLLADAGFRPTHADFKRMAIIYRNLAKVVV